MTRGATHRFIPNPLTADSTGKISGTVVLDNPTGNEAALTLNYTTNKLTSGNDTGLLINMTDTLSPGTSKVLDIQVGAATKLNVLNSGNVGIGIETPVTKLEVYTPNASYQIGLLVGDKAAGGNFYMLENTLNSGYGSNIDNFSTWLNFRGFQNGTSRYRDLIVGNGKEGSIIKVIGSAGNVGIGIETPNANAILDLTSTTKAFMPPRMTTTQRDAIATPTEGMLIFNLTTHVLNYYGAAAWAAV